MCPWAAPTGTRWHRCARGWLGEVGGGHVGCAGVVRGAPPGLNLREQPPVGCCTTMCSRHRVRRGATRRRMRPLVAVCWWWERCPAAAPEAFSPPFWPVKKV